RTVASVPDWRTLNGNWLNIDGRAGFVVRGSSNPIGVAPTAVSLSLGPAAGADGMVVQGLPGRTPAQTARAAKRPQPTGGPDRLAAAVNGDHLSLFNLSGTPIDRASLTIPQDGRSRLVYLGRQRTTPEGIAYRTSLPAMAATVEAPRFRITAAGSIAGLEVEVVDSLTVAIRNRSAADRLRLRVESVATGEIEHVRVARGDEAELRFSRGPRT